MAKEEVVEKQTETTKKAPAATSTTVVDARQSSKRIWMISGIIGLVGFALIVGALIGATRQSIRSNWMYGQDTRAGMRAFDDDGGLRGNRPGMMGGGQTATNDSSRAYGVVTAIDGSTITIAGQGATKKVTTNDSTQYYGAAQPVKVNDTIMAIGSTSGDTFTASRITIQRQ